MSRLIHTLTAADRPRIERHLRTLSPEDRRLRFGLALGDEALHDYVEAIRFDRDAVFGVCDEQFELAAVAHLGCADDSAELGLSVRPDERRRGHGLALLMRVVRRARTLGFERLWVHCLAENRAMVALAAKAGMRVEVAAGEADAYLALPPPTPFSLGLDLYESQLTLLLRTWRDHAA